MVETAEDVQMDDDFIILLDQAAGMHSAKLSDYTQLAMAMLKSEHALYLSRSLLRALVQTGRNRFDEDFSEWFYPPPPYEATPEATREANREANPEATREANPQATREANPEATREATREATPEAASEATPEGYVSEGDVSDGAEAPSRKRKRVKTSRAAPHRLLLDTLGYTDGEGLVEYFPWTRELSRNFQQQHRNNDMDLLLRYDKAGTVVPGVGFEEHLRYILRGRHLEKRSHLVVREENKTDRNYLFNQGLGKSCDDKCVKKALKNFNHKCTKAWECVKLLGWGILVSRQHITKAGGNIYKLMSEDELSSAAQLLEAKELPTRKYDSQMEHFVEQKIL
ncbi:hypothetical protein DFS34DRAFT_618377, partial [Phlyctochytrium arcticum]